MLHNHKRGFGPFCFFIPPVRSMRRYQENRPILWQFIQWILAAAFIPAALLYQGHLGSHDVARVVQLALLLSVALLGALVLGQTRFSQRAAVELCALIVLASASTLRAELPGVSVREVVLFAGLATLACVTNLAASRYGLDALGKPLFLAMAAYSAVQVTAYSAGLLLEGQTNSWGLGIGYENPRFLNHVQSVAIPLLVGLSLSPTLASSWRVAAGASAVVQFAIMAALFGRASFVALAGCAVIAGLAFGTSGRRFSKRLVFVALLGLACDWLMFTGLPALLHATKAAAPALTSEATSDHSRFYLWHLALEQIAQHPGLGIGPMHLAHHPNFKGAHPHNVYLQIAAEFGLPFAVLLSLVAVRALLCAARRLRTDDPPASDVATGALAACVAAAIDGFFSGNFVMPNSQLWIAVAAGLAYAGTVKSDPGKGVRYVIVPAAVGRAFCLMMSIAMLVLLIQSLREAAMPNPHLDAQTTPSSANDKWRPRYWRDGWF
ncbi:MAG: O-antigen ligase domain-containing protein [Roseateles sp.]|nr:MAG: O-antigen ligase domain-containing protein [Roseateles sp.]